MKYLIALLFFVAAFRAWGQEVISSTVEIEVSQDSFYYLKNTKVRDIGGPLNDTLTTRIYLGMEPEASGKIFNAAIEKEMFISAGIRRALVARDYQIQGETESIEIKASYTTLSGLYSDITGNTLADTTRENLRNWYGVTPLAGYDTLKTGVYYRLDDLAANPDTSHVCEMISVGNGTWRLRDTSTLQLWIVVPYSRDNFRINNFRGENYEMLWTREVFADNRRLYWPTTRIVPALNATEVTPLKIIRLP